MATSTQYPTTTPVNGAFALSAIKAANTAQDVAHDVTAKLIALRKELEILRAERDQARFRVEDLEAQTARLHRDLQRNSVATSVLRTCPRRLPRTMSFVLAFVAFAAVGMASGISPAVAKPPATDAVYVCEVEGKLPIYLNITRHRFRFSDQSGPLHEGRNLSFTTSRGYTMTLSLGDPGMLRLERPTYVEGNVSVSGNGSAEGPEHVFCALSGPASVGRKIPAGSERSIEALKEREFNANLSCRGGSGDSRRTQRACALRDRLDRELEARGFCHAVEKTETTTNSVWKRCP